MNLLGSKTILRAIEPQDSEMLMNLINDPETEYHVGGWSFPVSTKGQREWIENLQNDKSEMRCVITDKENKKSVGTIILNNIDYKNGSAQIHIKIASEVHRGKGYGSDAVSTVVTYGFNELRLHCIYANVNEDNLASVKLFSKCGFEHDGLLRDRIFKRGKYLNVKTLSIINAYR